MIKKHSSNHRIGQATSIMTCEKAKHDGSLTLCDKQISLFLLYKAPYVADVQ